MKRFLTAVVVWAALAATATAQDVAGSLLAQLSAQGYEVVYMQRTWLGRMRVVAENDAIRREIVFNPGTGEILRDYAVTLASLSDAPAPRPPHRGRE